MSDEILRDELRAALRGRGRNVTALEWFEVLLNGATEFAGQAEDPEAMWTALDRAEELLRDLRALEAKLEGRR